MPTRTTGLMRWKTEHRYGGPTRSIDGNPTITTTAARVASAKPDRVALDIFNVGTVTMFIAINGAVASNNGIPITPGSGVSFHQDDDDTLPTEAWFAVVGSSTTVAYVIETLSDTILAPEEIP